jgi:hypothetical protein
MNYTIVVNDGGELKTISATEMEERDRRVAADIQCVLEEILDARTQMREAAEGVVRSYKSPAIAGDRYVRIHIDAFRALEKAIAPSEGTKP